MRILKALGNALLALSVISVVSTSFASQLPGQDAGFHAKRLVTAAEHKGFLISVLDSCNKNDSVTITSYNISPKIFQNNIANSIIAATSRGAKIYIYFEHQGWKWLEKADYCTFRNLINSCAKFEQNCNHSKCVMKNAEVLAIGSYNWLSDFNDTSSNGTVILRGPLCSPLKEDIWLGVRFYQSLKHGNRNGIYNFAGDDSVYTPKPYPIESKGHLDLLRTPEAHCAFLSQVFKEAQSHIYIFSPFIRFKRLQDTFTNDILKDLQKRQIRTILITLPNPCSKSPQEQDWVFSCLDQMQKTYPCFSLRIQKDFHAKTLVCDSMVCEGSFNWLSAVGDLGHDANNYEVSVAIKGDYALSLLSNLRASTLGKAVLPDARVNNTPVALQIHRAPKVPVAKAPNEPNNRTSFPEDFIHDVKIFPGFNNEGYCVIPYKGYPGTYIRDYHREIFYFESEKEAVLAAYKEWRRNLAKETSYKKRRIFE